MAELLGYKYKKDAICDNVDENNKMPYHNLLEFLGESENLPLKNIDKETIFVNVICEFTFNRGLKSQ